MDHFLDKTHGRFGFSASGSPALKITPGTGETIGFETSDEVYAQLHEFHDMEKLTVGINPVTGPVYVEGARPGDALAVTIHDIRLKDRGWSVSLPGSGALQYVMGEEMFTRRVPIDDDGVHVTDRHTFEPLPMIGCIGTAPAEGSNSTIMPSTPQGGNMDLVQCRPGSTVYLPVMVEGAYLSIGDIHAIMAEGESSFVAIEAEGIAVVSVDVVRDLNLRAPRVETADEWIFVGLGDPVQESIRRGYEDMFHFLVSDHGWDRGDAYAVMSAVGHSQLGGPTGSAEPDPLHPFSAVGAVTIHRLPKSVLAGPAAGTT
ncbi:MULTISPECIES: acetamidase/formamidase family protein [unclassified Arthrobacter]|uniref:acetamidase/formamidase family protein n=1 Tax=unclassified Arthrobacter TaxID=235627 RepID=UPI001D138F6B|nr:MULTISPECIES: acetamidase/formamidase family protein [unclassified Arthrobacter]MCC3277375.1 acetamidase/formamidase family protein [Arthrobacter sp. zg-Y20]MCC9178227.1 acetamidase/formamidase family protein [Arthrobacter sp. zg-Y750]MDK1317535.1 acetamidase/formamidase family protein [Arthrobacter sp. zg.Y20]WIB06968.1 acetamidase/formamidase family protein [Arthrobacter sp. zg-Y20]